MLALRNKISCYLFHWSLEVFMIPLLIVGFLMFSGCSNENAPDCFQKAGKIERKEVSVPDFTKITVFEKIGLILKQGDTQKVEIETGEFLQKEIRVTVEEGRLVLRNENGCNFLRDYGLTKIYVTAPNITEIRSSTGLAIKSDGVLAYPSLKLLSESFNNPETETTDGEFDLELASQNVSIVSNGIVYIKLKGTTENLNMIIAAGDSRIETENLVTQNVNLNHRGSNDMFINPQLEIKGVIRGSGDVISVNKPATIEVQELYRGRLIFR